MASMEQYHSLSGLVDHLNEGGWIRHASWVDFCIRKSSSRWVGYHGKGSNGTPILRPYTMPPGLACSRSWSPCEEPSGVAPAVEVERANNPSDGGSFVPPFWAPPTKDLLWGKPLTWEEALKAHRKGYTIERLLPGGYSRRLTPGTTLPLLVSDLTATDWRVVYRPTNPC